MLVHRSANIEDQLCSSCCARFERIHTTTFYFNLDYTWPCLCCYVRQLDLALPRSKDVLLADLVKDATLLVLQSIMPLLFRCHAYCETLQLYID